MDATPKKPYLGIASISILVGSFLIASVWLYFDPFSTAAGHDEHLAVALEIGAKLIRSMLVFAAGVAISFFLALFALIRGESRVVPVSVLVIDFLIFVLFLFTVLGR